MLKFFQRLFGRFSEETPAGSESLRAALVGQARAERAMRHSGEEFKHLVAGVRDYAIFLLDVQGRVYTWNDGAERIKGYRPEEIIGQHFSCFYPKEVVTSGWPDHELQMAAATGRFEDEGWRIRKDGSRFWANVVITALRDESGSVRGFLEIARDLTDRKQAEEKLRLSEERFRLMIENVKDYAIFMLDPQGRVVTWNEGAQRLKGYTAEEIIGQHFSRFYPEDPVRRGWPDEELRRAAAEGRFEDEGWRVRKDGSRFWANVVITALRDESGMLRGFGKVTRDLTERRLAEENARRLVQEEAARKAAEESAQVIDRQREQLHVTLASIGDAVIVTDNQSGVTFLNAVAEELTGWRLDEAVGQPIKRVFHIINEESREVVENPVSKVFQEGRVVGLANHTVLLARDGREFPIEDSGAPIRGKDQAVGGAVLVFRDVTEARKALQNRIHLAAIVESSDDAIIGLSLDGTITSWNRGAKRLYGYTAAEVVGQPSSILAPSDHPDEQQTILERIKRGEFIEHYETVRVRKDGRRVDVALTISPIHNPVGKIIGASKIARDITSRKEEDRRRNEFLALLAHELRNPMAPLRNGLEVMRLAGNDPKAVEQARSMMERQLQHLVRLVDDLLDVSRISRGKLKLRKERIPLAAVVSHALEVCEALVKESGDELTVTLPKEQVYVDADKIRLAQSLCNLLSNAVKYSDPGSKIWLTVQREGNEAVIHVKDTGVGIPPHLLPRVFDLFWQVDRSLEKSQGGLGVGLTIVKRLIEMHGGKVEAHSEGEGMGSEFVVHLPLVKPLTPEQSVEKSGQLSSSSGRRRVLIVDDNVDAANSLAMVLRAMDHDVQTAHDGFAGLEAAAAFHPDLILLDIGMPRLNGYDVCRRIREQPWAQRVAIFALTGWGQEEDKRRSHESGFNGHLVKPVEPATLDKLLSDPSSEAV
ncbi:MAG TPA: PAS domain S-box protein [Gemmataceae bacterium]|nr:PAS domain S-box protein [Gemmataceae bacterium]